MQIQTCNPMDAEFKHRWDNPINSGAYHVMHNDIMQYNVIIHHVSHILYAVEPDLSKTFSVWGLAPIRQVRRSNRKSHAGLPEVFLLSNVFWTFSERVLPNSELSILNFVSPCLNWVTLYDNLYCRVHQSHEICLLKIRKTMMKSYERDGTNEIVSDVPIASSETLPRGVSH